MKGKLSNSVSTWWPPSSHREQGHKPPTSTEPNISLMCYPLVRKKILPTTTTSRVRKHNRFCLSPPVREPRKMKRI